MEAGSVITEAIIDTPVESHVRTPITAVPMIEAVRKTPVTRSPKVSGLRHLHPAARNPEIAVISVAPIARIPKISILRTRWLFVGDEGRRRDCNRDRLSKESGRGAQQTREEDVSDFHQIQHR